MHLKLDTSGSIDDGDVARDLGQDPADIVVLSAADSDLSAFGAAHASLPKDFPSVRLTNLLALGHPASVDLYVERTLCEARIVVLRMLGGESYWPHGVESLRSDALRRGTLFACIPGEMDWNANDGGHCLRLRPGRALTTALREISAGRGARSIRCR
jgi:cobaltochelatase CobN